MANENIDLATRTLRERLTGLPAPVPPSHPEVAAWRPLTVGDAELLLALDHAIGAVDHPEYTSTLEHISNDLGYSHIDLSTDSFVGVAEDGTAIAYGITSLGPGVDTRVQSYVLGGVHPEWRGRGIGRELLRWQAERSREQLSRSDHALPGWSLGYLPERVTDGLSLFAREGYEVQRYFTGMRRDVSQPIPEIVPGEGEDPRAVRIVPFTAELSESARIARNDSFRDHWGSQPSSAEQWEKMVTGEDFAPELSRVAVVDEPDGSVRVVGFGLAEVNRSDWETQGFTSSYIDYIGVVRDFRRRRIAPAILVDVLRAIRDAGYERALLDVDTASPTGANSLYEGLGFEATHVEQSLVREY